MDHIFIDLNVYNFEVVGLNLSHKVDAPNDNISDSLRHPLRYA